MHAYAEARVHFERALELWDPSVDRVDLLARAAQAARFAGDPERAVALCREAIALTDEPERTALLYERLGEFHFWDDEAALECYDRALELLPGEPRLLAAQGHALMGLRRWDESRECCEAALEAGAAPRITLGVVLAFLGEPEAGEAHLRARARAGRDRRGDRARVPAPRRAAARARRSRAARWRRWWTASARRRGSGCAARSGTSCTSTPPTTCLRLGRWDEAAERLAEAARMELSRTAARAAPRDRGAAARRCAASSRRRGGSSTPPPTTGCPASSSRRWRRPVPRSRSPRASPPRPRVHVDGALGGVQDPFYTPPLYSLGLRAEADAAEHARARRREPDRGRAGALLAALDALVDGAAPPGRAGAPRARPRRALAASRARPPPSSGARRRPRSTRSPSRIPAAYARLHEAEATLLAGGERRAGGARARRGARDRGRARRGAAARSGRGARPARAARPRRRRRRPARRRRRRRRPDRRARPRCCSCSPKGSRTARSPARLFISQKTVAAHMAHIYGKLGVHSRVEAAGRAQQLGVLERPLAPDRHRGGARTTFGGAGAHLWPLGGGRPAVDRAAGHRRSRGTPSEPEGLMSPRSLGRRCAGGLVAARPASSPRPRPAPAQTHASVIQTHA